MAACRGQLMCYGLLGTDLGETGSHLTSEPEDIKSRKALKACF